MVGRKEGRAHGWMDGMKERKRWGEYGRNITCDKGKMRPVETILRMGEGIKENDREIV
jgi:hypothetical protein